jgi:hypothetical protein
MLPVIVKQVMDHCELSTNAPVGESIWISNSPETLPSRCRTPKPPEQAPTSGLLAEARVADLEGYERDLRDQQEQVERLGQVWGGWAATLDADVPTARQILKKILVGRIYVRPIGPDAWRFAGISRYDGALRGGLGRAAEVLPAYGARYDDFCQLMLHLLVPAPDQDPSTAGRDSLFGLCTEGRPARVIAGGSDAEGWDQAGGVSSGPPRHSSRWGQFQHTAHAQPPSEPA